MKKAVLILAALLAVLLVVYYAGPRLESEIPDKAIPSVEADINGIEQWVRDRESGMPVKPGNESRIMWADSVGKETEWVLLYLHGFTASSYEGFPVTRDFVERFNTNAYLPRLAGHGLDVEEPLLDMTPKRLYDSAKEALAVAHKLGKKVLVMGTSTGCTLALMLAADFPELTDALVLYSPNIKIRNPFAGLLSGPWGLQISRAVHGGKYAESVDPAGSETCKYWYCKYRVEAQVYLQQLLDLRMNEQEFAKVKQPVFLGYYYKDEEHQDPTIDVKAALNMFDELGTPADKKMKVAFPDAGAHVIGCELTSRSVEEVEQRTFEFVASVLKLQ